jgi:predicted metal-dependent enzyme (double-stranded beta helix superfamily)
MVAAESRRERLVEDLRPAFAELLAADHWLPPEFARPSEAGGMGGGIGTYLLCRHGGALSLMSLVVPAGAATPVHDHLAWGLVGLYRGEQDEEVYRRVDDGKTAGAAVLELVERRHLKPGDFYGLLPPEGDIHRVCTTSSFPSISIHLLGNDVGCVWRHAYEPEARVVRDFRSGYANVPCRD